MNNQGAAYALREVKVACVRRIRERLTELFCERITQQNSFLAIFTEEESSRCSLRWEIVHRYVKVKEVERRVEVSVKLA